MGFTFIHSQPIGKINIKNQSQDGGKDASLKQMQYYFDVAFPLLSSHRGVLLKMTSQSKIIKCMRKQSTANALPDTIALSDQQELS